MSLIKKLIKLIYLSLFDIFKLIINCRKKYNYIIIFPRLISLIFKKILIFDKNKKKFFFQEIRNLNDSFTVHEIFSEENYNLLRFKISKSLKQFFDKESKIKRPIIIDCGSNIGSSSCYFSRQYKNALVILVEPDIKNFNFSKKNAFGNDFLYFNKAISNQKQIKKFLIDDKDNRGSRISDLGSNEVECITVKDILEYSEKSNQFPFLIKIDIEGYEKELFRNNYDWVDKFKVIIIELHDWMLPGQNNSFNFLNAISNIMNNNKKRDLIISGENLILIRIDE